MYTHFHIFIDLHCTSSYTEHALPQIYKQLSRPRDCIKTHFDLTFLAIGSLTQRSIPER